MRSLTLWLAILASMLLSGCPQKPAPPLRIALNAWPGYEFLFLADQLGYFKEEGVDVKLIPFQTLADGRRAFERRQVDVMGGSVVELYTSRDIAGFEPAVFLVTDDSNGSDMLLARKEFLDVLSLRGKKLALEIGTLDVLTSANALASAGLTFGDVQVVPMPQPSAIKALLAGEVDAVQTYPPFATEALASAKVTKLFDSSQTPGEIVDMLIAHRSDLAERSGDYGRMVRAFYRARQYHAEHPDDANRRMAGREHIKPFEFVEALSGTKLARLEDQRGYLDQGKLVPVLAKVHATLTAVGAIKGPPCGTECMSTLAVDAAARR
ncbi:MAG: ABC transporter substrate-binding protein [Sulfurimicrobium sp.]|nr:ABC transporter substrate-binding protein [Sulfurimicrobium sp.]